MEKKLTTTFTIHHDRCDMSKWTIGDFQLLVEFVKTQSLCAAAALSRRGLQLVLSEAHEPKGGSLEPIGVALEDNLNEYAPDLTELDLDEDVTAVVPIYRGPTEFVVQYGIGDDEGNYDGHEYETFATEGEAIDFLKSLSAARSASEDASSEAVTSV